MDLLKCLEPMKNLPNRFSNLAFWRGVRKLKDEMLKTFEYVGEWGNGIESQITDIKNDITTLENTDTSLDSRISALENGGGGGGSVEDEIAAIKSDITNLENADNSLDSRISTLESSDINLNTEITNIKNDITTLENADTSLDSRISALENAGGGGSGGGSGALVFNSNSKSFNPTTIEVLKSNLDVSDAGALIVPYPKVVYARLIGILDNLETNSLIVNALMSGSVAVSKGTQYSNTVQFTDEPMYAVRINDTSYKLYTGWIPFTTKTKDGFKITMPNLTVNYTTAVMQ